MTCNLEIKIAKRDGIEIFILKGRLDVASAPLLEEKLKPLLLLQESKVLLDFAHVNYLSSAGMRLILSATKKMQLNLALCSIHEEVMEIIKIAGFEKILKIYPNKETALAALKA